MTPRINLVLTLLMGSSLLRLCIAVGKKGLLRATVPFSEIEVATVSGLYQSVYPNKKPSLMAGFFADWGKYSEDFLILCVKKIESHMASEFPSIWKAISRIESVINMDD